MTTIKVKIKKTSLPEVEEKKEFNFQEFLKLANKVKKITDKEKKDGFLSEEYGRNSRYSL